MGCIDHLKPKQQIMFYYEIYQIFLKNSTTYNYILLRLAISFIHFIVSYHNKKEIFQGNEKKSTRSCKEKTTRETGVASAHQTKLARGLSVKLSRPFVGTLVKKRNSNKNLVLSFTNTWWGVGRLGGGISTTSTEQKLSGNLSPNWVLTSGNTGDGHE